jgi:ketosteroid isomerase-like protein
MAAFMQIYIDSVIDHIDNVNIGRSICHVSRHCSPQGCTNISGAQPGATMSLRSPAWLPASNISSLEITQWGGGSRHTAAGFRRRLERLYRLNRKLQFTIKHIAVSGTPWNTTATVEWRDTAILADGNALYFNDGVHVIRMRWGKVTSIHAYLDTQKVAAAFEGMVKAGIAEAGASAIED